MRKYRSRWYKFVILALEEIDKGITHILCVPFIRGGGGGGLAGHYIVCKYSSRNIGSKSSINDIQTTM